MEKSVLDIICASLDSFFESERKIGTYIIQHTAEVVDMTVGELAQACGVSDASVSRFCKKINMKGFHHLKITLAKEISEKGIEEEEVSNHISVNDIEQSLKNILANKVTEITQTVSMMDAKQLSEILNKLNIARTVQFFAVGNTIPVAIDGAFKLNQIGIFTMGDIARCSIGEDTSFYNEDLLYRTFGINAELLIDHAWGYEPCTMKDIKSYEPETKSIGSGQVLSCAYSCEKAKLVLKEMINELVLDLFEKMVMTDQIVLTVEYDTENLKSNYKGEISTDMYGRKIPKHAHGTRNLEEWSASGKKIMKAGLSLYDEIVDPVLSIRKLYVTANHIISNTKAEEKKQYQQISMFDLLQAENEGQEKVDIKRDDIREKNLQKAELEIKKRFGKNAIMRGISLEKGATAKERNDQIGGHKA